MASAAEVDLSDIAPKDLTGSTITEKAAQMVVTINSSQSLTFRWCNDNKSKGGYGCVRIATVTSLNTTPAFTGDMPFAVKIQKVTDGNTIDIIINEHSKLKAATSKLAEINNYQASFKIGDTVYTIMKKAPGLDLHTYAENYQTGKSKVPSALEFTRIFKAITLKMTSLHNVKRSIVHQDLKPANIMICESSSRDKVSGLITPGTGSSLDRSNSFLHASTGSSPKVTGSAGGGAGAGAGAGHQEKPTETTKRKRPPPFFQTHYNIEIIDFGFAKKANNKNSRLPVGGTPYTTPRVAKKGGGYEDANFSHDIFSLGGIFWHLLATRKTLVDYSTNRKAVPNGLDDRKFLRNIHNNRPDLRQLASIGARSICRTILPKGQIEALLNLTYEMLDTKREPAMTALEIYNQLVEIEDKLTKQARSPAGTVTMLQDGFRGSPTNDVDGSVAASAVVFAPQVTGYGSVNADAATQTTSLLSKAPKPSKSCCIIL